MVEFQNEILVNCISWKYNEGCDNVLADLSIKIRKGDAIGLIGESGSGKTTLVDIILGLLKPQSGTVEVDGHDIFSISDKWGKMVGYVPQNVYLIDDSIRNNIIFGEDFEMETDDKIWDVLEKAQLKKYVLDLPNGLDTIVGERGVKLSGGQKQRIAIARALYHNPQILILDEATAALDNETERAVMDSIEALQGHITMIIVAHRLTTIKKCNIVYEICNGRALEINKESV